jgi:DNA-binding beta-propeller fold protein YncE
MNDGHRFVRRLPTFEVREGQAVENVKGICASAATGRLYVSTIRRLMAMDLNTGQRLWEREYEGGCDRMSISPDGKLIYLPSLEQAHWNVVDGATGDVVRKIVLNSGAHNTVYGADGRRVYMAGLRSNYLSIADTRNHSVIGAVGPFSAPVRPFTVNARQTLCFVNVNDLLGFEVGDIRTGRKLHQVEVKGFEKGMVKRHGCPSHGIALTPDEREIWLTDAANRRLHIFDARNANRRPPPQVASIELRDQPGWVTFSIDGKYAYPSTGEVIDPPSRRIIATLTDEAGREVQSEKMLEVVFRDGRVVRTGDQFGVGRRR